MDLLNCTTTLKLLNHAEQVTEYLAALQYSHVFSDLIVHCSNGKVKTHCAILSCMSPFLEKLLLDHQITDEPVNLFLPDVAMDDIKGLLSLLYTGISNVCQR